MLGSGKIVDLFNFYLFYAISDDTNKMFTVHYSEIQGDLAPILRIITSALRNGKNDSLRAIAGQIKKSCDLQFGKYWHCIIGKNFGSDISHGKQKRLDITMYSLVILINVEAGCFLFGYAKDDIAILLYKTTS